MFVLSKFEKPVHADIISEIEVAFTREFCMLINVFSFIIRVFHTNLQSFKNILIIIQFSFFHIKPHIQHKSVDIHEQLTEQISLLHLHNFFIVKQMEDIHYIKEELERMEFSYKIFPFLDFLIKEFLRCHFV